MLSILVPTDFSENSWNAIRYALEYFKYERAAFYFMHAYQKEFYEHQKLVSREVYEEVKAEVSSESERQLERLLVQVKAFCPNPRFQFHTISAYNSLVEEANEIVDRKNIDLVVMGTKGKSNDRRIAFGSQTFQVLKYVQCPVLAVPAHYNNTRPRRILFPTDYMIPYKRRELRLLCDMAAPYRSVVDVLHVSKTGKLSLRQEDNQQFLKDVVCKNEINFICQGGNDVSSVIQEYMAQHQVDMLVMVNTQSSFLENMLFPSTLDKVSLNLEIPLLALQNATRHGQ